MFKISPLKKAAGGNSETSVPFHHITRRHTPIHVTKSFSTPTYRQIL